MPKGNLIEKPYLNFHSKELILLGINFVLESNEKCTFERLVAECFTRFPEFFSFKRYPQWPDSMKFDRGLRTLRAEGLIVGSSKDHFLITPKGQMVVLRLLEKTRREKPVSINKKNSPASRSAEERLVAYLENHPIFKKFLAAPDDFTIEELEFRNMLRCTMDSPSRILRQNLEYFKFLAREFNNDKLLEFLLVCEKKFKYLF